MDYKAKLQTNNTNLTNNNVDLQSILNTINELPEVSGGGSTVNLDAEINDQNDIITQLQTAIEGKTSAEPKLQSKIVTPNVSQQTVTPDTGYDGLSDVTVNAIPSTYVEPTSTKTATTYTPSTSNQTIDAGTYCSGTQTIEGDANLIADNIKSGVSIFGVDGSYVGSGSGGANIATCTVDVSSSTNHISGELTTYDGNTISTGYVDTMSIRTRTLQNVVCGSVALLQSFDIDSIITVNGEEIDMSNADYSNSLIGYCYIPNESTVTIEANPSDIQGV